MRPLPANRFNAALIDCVRKVNMAPVEPNANNMERALVPGLLFSNSAFSSTSTTSVVDTENFVIVF